tara:strand:- start:204 stop:542 length:339 start_codon:yes stop_codon:yes gene_type:complete
VVRFGAISGGSPRFRNMMSARLNTNKPTEQEIATERADRGLSKDLARSMAKAGYKGSRYVGSLEPDKLKRRSGPNIQARRKRSLSSLLLKPSRKATQRAGDQGKNPARITGI